MTADQVMPGAEQFLLPAGETGCLLIHGIIGTPQQMKYVGEYLAANGITASGVRLKGHGTRVEDMHDCSYQDWIKSAEEALFQLTESCTSVFCAGLSMGGVISMRLARLHPETVKGVITICSPYKLRSIKFKFVPLLKYVVKSFPAGKASLNDPEAYEVNYDYHSVPAVHQLMKLTAVVRGDLPHIRQPALIFGGRDDWVVDSRDPGLYHDNLASRDKELIWLENSQHVATLDYDKEILSQKIAVFINKNK